MNGSRKKGENLKTFHHEKMAPVLLGPFGPFRCSPTVVNRCRQKVRPSGGLLNPKGNNLNLRAHHPIPRIRAKASFNWDPNLMGSKPPALVNPSAPLTGRPLIPFVLRLIPGRKPPT